METLSPENLAKISKGAHRPSLSGRRVDSFVATSAAVGRRIPAVFKSVGRRVQLVQVWVGQNTEPPKMAKSQLRCNGGVAAWAPRLPIEGFPR
ncbi:unnamed protein product [Ixodes pacificus]